MHQRNPKALNFFFSFFFSLSFSFSNMSKHIAECLKYLEGQHIVFCPSPHFLLSLLRRCSVGCRVGLVATWSVFLVMPRECMSQEVLKNFLCLCAFRIGWVEQLSGGFAEKVHFLNFPDIQLYKKLHLLGEGRVPPQSLCVKGDIFESKDESVSTIIITIEYNSIMSPSCRARFKYDLFHIDSEGLFRQELMIGLFANMIIYWWEETLTIL